MLGRLIPPTWDACKRGWTKFEAWHQTTPALLWKVLAWFIGVSLAVAALVVGILQLDSGSNTSSPPTTTTTTTTPPSQTPSQTPSPTPPSPTPTTTPPPTTSPPPPPPPESPPPPAAKVPSSDPSPQPSVADGPPQLGRDGAGNLYVRINGEWYRCDKIDAAFSGGAGFRDTDVQRAARALGGAQADQLGAPPLPPNAAIAAGLPPEEALIAASLALGLQQPAP
jgi:hypothetical protein